MRLRNVFVLTAFLALSLGAVSCGKKTEEVKPADSMMTPAPAPAPAPAPTPAPNMDSARRADSIANAKMKGKEMKKK